MWKFRLLQRGTSLSLCVITLCGCVLFAGCGKDEAPAKESPYAQLDARFPKGQPLAASAQERAQDTEYLAKIESAAKELAELQRSVVSSKRAVENFRTQVVKAMTAKRGKEPSEAMVAEQLSKKAYYQELLAAQKAAEAAVEAKRQANQELIRQRMWADAEAYKAMKAEADAKAVAAGLPVRGAPRAAQAAQSAQPAVKPAAAVQPVAVQPALASASAEAPAKESKPLTVETLSKETGLPVVPSAN